MKNPMGERYQAILAAVPDIIMEVDRHRVYSWANRAGLEFFGPEVIGREAADFFVGSQDTYVDVQPVFNGDEEVIYVESWQRRQDGEVRLLAWWCRVLKDEAGQVIGALSTARDITEIRRNEDELQQARAKAQAILDATQDSLLLLDREGTILTANATAARRLGRTPEELRGLNVYDDLLEGELRGSRRKRIEQVMSMGEPESFEDERAGMTLQNNIFPVRDESGRVTGVAVQAQDVTPLRRAEEERRELEDQLRRSQRLEGIGQLAGGIAHDFNNILLGILARSEFLLEGVEPSDSRHEDLVGIQRSAGRAADLTRQLLAFSRRQVLRPRVLDLNDQIDGLLKMLRRIIGEHIILDFRSGPNLSCCQADPGQIQQVLMNLCLNARDAMPEGGTLSLGTREVTLDAEYCRTHPWARPGSYILVEVSDTGSGMEPEVQAQIFEPFFTTKGPGLGTGLGLATAYGIIRQHEGMLEVYSEPGQGSCFKVYLPRSEQPEEETIRREAPSVIGGTETILLAEDDQMVRELAIRALEGAGYRVIATEDGREALERFQAEAEAVDLAFLDVVMPHLGGREVGEALIRLRPELPILFTSGYSIEGVHTGFILNPEVQLLQKPYGIRELLQRIRAILES